MTTATKPELDRPLAQEPIQSCPAAPTTTLGLSEYLVEPFKKITNRGA